MTHTADPSQTRSRKRSQILVTLFFSGLILFTLALLAIIVPRVQHLRRTSGDDIPHWLVIEVVAGDLIRVESGGTNRLVHVYGIGCPPLEANARFREAQLRLGLPDHELLQRGLLARNTLSTWIYRRQAQVLTQAAPKDHPYEAYVRVSGVDVGKKMVENGQAYALEIPHQHLEYYQSLEAAARKRAIGIWRAP
jgi:endonuclease YncB( thermonuclease family)